MWNVISADQIKIFCQAPFLFIFLNHQNQMIVSIVCARLEVNMILLCQRTLLCKNLKDEVQSAESFDSRNAGGQSGECAPRRLLFHTDLALLQCRPPARPLQPVGDSFISASLGCCRCRRGISVSTAPGIEAFISLSPALPFLPE